MNIKKESLKTQEFIPYAINIEVKSESDESNLKRVLNNAIQYTLHFDGKKEYREIPETILDKIAE